MAKRVELVGYKLVMHLSRIKGRLKRSVTKYLPPGKSVLVAALAFNSKVLKTANTLFGLHNIKTDRCVVRHAPTSPAKALTKPSKRSVVHPFQEGSDGQKATVFKSVLLSYLAKEQRT